MKTLTTDYEYLEYEILRWSENQDEEKNKSNLKQERCLTYKAFNMGVVNTALCQQKKPSTDECPLKRSISCVMLFVNTHTNSSQ